MLEKDAIDVQYTDTINIKYYTAVQVADEVNENVTTIRSWTQMDKFGDILDIQRVNGRRVFTKEDIIKIKFIKSLRDAGMSINQIKEYISKNGFEYAEYNSGLVDPKDPLGFQALASALSIEVDSKLQQFMDAVTQSIVEANEQVLKEAKKDIIESVSDVVDDRLEVMSNTIKEDNSVIQEKISEEINKKLDDSINEIKEEIKKTAYVTKDHIDEYKNRSWFNRLFNK